MKIKIEEISSMMNQFWGIFVHDSLALKEKDLDLRQPKRNNSI